VENSIWKFHLSQKTTGDVWMIDDGTGEGAPDFKCRWLEFTLPLKANELRSCKKCSNLFLFCGQVSQIYRSIAKFDHLHMDQISKDSVSRCS
jgi:hypothetical protein